MTTEPIKPYLVQRARFYDNPAKKGIDSILRFDYMGSSEFEFGALGNSLRRIRRRLEMYDYFDVELIGTNPKCRYRKFTIFCKTSKKDEVVAVVEGLINRTSRLKEFCDIGYYVEGREDSNDHWWDLDYDFMVWKENAAFTEKFKTAIKG